MRSLIILLLFSVWCAEGFSQRRDPTENRTLLSSSIDLQMEYFFFRFEDRVLKQLFAEAAIEDSKHSLRKPNGLWPKNVIELRKIRKAIDLDKTSNRELWEKISPHYHRSEIHHLRACQFVKFGPIAFLKKKEVRELLGITKEQYAEIERVRAKVLTKSMADLRKIRQKGLAEFFEGLSRKDRDKFEKLLGYKLSDLCEHYANYPTEWLSGITTRLAGLRLEPPYSAISAGYVMNIDPLYDEQGYEFFVDHFLSPNIAENRFPEKRSLSDKQQLQRFENLVEYKVDFNKLDERDEGTAILPFAPVEDKGYKAGTIEIFLRAFKLEKMDEERLKKFPLPEMYFMKSDEFRAKVVEEMTEQELQTALDAIFATIGPIRTLLLKPVYTYVGLKPDEVTLLRKESPIIYKSMVDPSFEVHKRAFNAIMDVLTDEQKAILEKNHLNLEFTANCYKYIDEMLFLRDFGISKKDSQVMRDFNPHRWRKYKTSNEKIFLDAKK